MAAPVILYGNNIDLLRDLPDNSIDSIVTDPPYELGFMGKKWDSSGIAYSVELWSECLRVLKSGGHLLAFSGSRTYHRMAVAIEDAGFEIRDQIMWVYGSGFPKSLDISKAIDKSDAKDEQQQRRYKFTEWVRSQAVTAKQIDEATNTMMGSHYTTHLSQPAIMTREHLEMCRHLFNAVPEWVETECDIRSVESKQFASREIIGQKTSGIANKEEKQRHTIGASKSITVDITTPATDEAQQWSGWGTALKPAHEPIVMARKPIDGTVANNVLKHGVGGINIDASRVGTEGESFDGLVGRPIQKLATRRDGETDDEYRARVLESPAQQEALRKLKDMGRFPANFIHDGSEEVTDLTGDAARFFYCAKASKAERNAGLEALPIQRRAGLQGSDNDKEVLDPVSERFRTEPSANFHPTVKPIALMRYLVRLVTPPNGTVLDPFAGSGSTLVAAILEGFSPVGMELTADYLPIINARVEWALNQEPDQPSLF
jgi:DNA modification methylase